jgi:hypothetical protein
VFAVKPVQYEAILPISLLIIVGVYHIVNRRRLAEYDRRNRWFLFARFVQRTTLTNMYLIIGIVILTVGLLLLAYNIIRIML